MMLRVENCAKCKKKIWIHFGYQSVQSSLLTNFTGTTGLAVITLEKHFITDFRYTEQAAAQAQGFEIIKMSDLF